MRRLPATRELIASRLDIATIVIFGVCFLFSLIIIRWVRHINIVAAITCHSIAIERLTCRLIFFSVHSTDCR